MLIKNYLIFRRSMGLTIFLLLSPLIICFIILFFQAIIDRFKNYLDLNPPVTSILSVIPKCQGPWNCNSIGYFILGEHEPWIDNVMTHVADNNNLKIGKDVKLLMRTKRSKSIMDYLNENKNQTQIAVVFCTGKWDINEQLSIPCQFDYLQDEKLVFYTIIYNYTLLYKTPYFSDMRRGYPKDAIAIKLKASIDNAILYEYSPDKNIHRYTDDYLHVMEQEYPRIPNRFIEGIDVAGNYGAFYFFAPFMLLFLITINELLGEKGKKLRQGLVVMGLSHFSYWLSWTITTLVLVSLLSIGMIVSGTLFGFDFFTKTPFTITFTLFLTFGLAIQFIAFFISTVCPDVKSGYTIAYAFILTAIVMQMFFTQSLLTVLFYRQDSSVWVEVVRTLFSFYPAFKYSMIYADISQKACRHYSLDENRWVEGQGYTYSDLFVKQSGKFTLQHEEGYQSPSAIENYIHLCLSALFYVLLTYYFDHILSSNRGRSESLIFFITNPFRFIYRRKTQPFIDEIQQVSEGNDSAEEEKIRVMQNYRNGTRVEGLRIVGLSKIYRKYPFGIESVEDVHALKEIFLELQQGELLALLGHNGAGKTTLIGILTGMHEPNSGTAQILGYDLQQSLSEIRKVMGFCPQFDILWNQLTAAEHLRMYASIKGVQESSIEREVNDRLREVDLLHVKDAQISTFSGGMKRRVSLAISAIGNPKVIILDEPTTGMDPKARRQVWQMIKNMKSQRVLLLTTHAMEEADALADRIAVMAQGQLRCIGNSLFLKNQYSDGYRLSIICDVENKNKVIDKISSLIPHSKLMDSSGGSLLFSIPLKMIHELKPFFQEIEGQHDKIIKEWGLSHSTLEEVFMKVTKQCD